VKPPSNVKMNQPPPPGEMQKFPSMSSVYTLASLAPGHGYIPRKQKPEKPFGLPYLTIMNRTHRGPGRKFINYALIVGGIGLLFFAGGALYFGHRNVSRMLVFRTEALGAIMIMVGIICVAVMGRYCARARLESNRWRAGIRFRAEGLHTAAPVNVEYVPEMEESGKLHTGTFGPRALKMIPKSKDMLKKKKKKRSRAPSKQDLLDEDDGASTPKEGLYQKNTEGPPGYNGHYPQEGAPVAYEVHDVPESPQFVYGPPTPSYTPGGNLRRHASEEKILLEGATRTSATGESEM